jgi:Flp pilus assembly protein TadD
MARKLLPIIGRLKLAQRVASLFVIISATFLVYWPAQRNGFVWDDTALVLRDPLIRSWRLIPESFHHFLFIDATPSNFYRPLQRLSFLADYAFWELQPRGYHLTSICVHAAAAIALFFLVEKLLPPRTAPRWTLAVALLWTVHPVHTSAVTYVAGRADPMAAAFGFAALALGLVSLERTPRARLATIAAALCFLAALLSKESGVTALLVWFVILVWRKEPRRVLATWMIIGLAVLAVYSGLRFTAEKVEPPHRATPPLAEQPILVARACAEYAGLLVLPINLRMERDIATDSLAGAPAGAARWRHFQTFFGLALILGLAAWWIWARRRAPVAGLALLAFFVAYVPISNLFPLNATVAEHWLYVPSAFLFLAVVGSLQALHPGWPKLVACAVALLAVSACFNAVRTSRRQADWLDQRTFLLRTIQAGGDTARMRVNLGQLASVENHDEEALAQFSEALERAPNLSFALLGMAASYVRLARYDEARPFLARAEVHPEIAVEARQLRAALEFRETGRDTSPVLREAAELAPKSWPPRKRYIAAMEEQGKIADAVQELREFLEQQPFRAESWRMLGTLLERLRDHKHAAAAFGEAARRDIWDRLSRSKVAELRKESGQGSRGDEGN